MNFTHDICVIGLGRVGLVTSLCLTKQGFRVLGIDKDIEKINKLKDKKPTIIEPDLEEMLCESIENHNFRLSSKIAKNISTTKFIIIAVGSPVKGDKVDLSQLKEVSEEIGKELKKTNNKPIIIVRSTVPPKTCRNIIEKIICESSNKVAEKDFYICINPEFIRAGSAIYDFFKPSRVVIGCKDKDIFEEVKTLYRHINCKFIMTSIESAEFSKYVDNSWHALKVSYINEISRISDSLELNRNEISEVFLSDEKLNLSSKYLKPGNAFGGSCLSKDTKAIKSLARDAKVNTPIIDNIIHSNSYHIEKLCNQVLRLNPKCVGFLGITFKENVEDLRDSVALDIIKRLESNGVKIIFNDQNITNNIEGLEACSLTEIARRSDVIVKIHDLEEYKNFNFTDKPIISF